MVWSDPTLINILRGTHIHPLRLLSSQVCLPVCPSTYTQPTHGQSSILSSTNNLESNHTCSVPSNTNHTTPESVALSALSSQLPDLRAVLDPDISCVVSHHRGLGLVPPASQHSPLPPPVVTW